MMWEATDECVCFVTEFLANVYEGRRENAAAPVSQDDQSSLTDFVDFLTPAVELFTNWPWMFAGAGVDSMVIARQSVYFGNSAQFGDGKPVILVPQLDSNLSFILLSNWLRVLGYRTATAGISADFDDQSIATLIRVTTKRIGRKAVLVAPASREQFVLAIAEAHKDLVSDIVLLNASRRLDSPLGFRAHFISSLFSLPFAMTALPHVLRNIQIELIETPSFVEPESGHYNSPLPSHTKHA
jgi:hypothetical protein